MNMHVANYEFGNRFNVEETRVRKLLMHKKEIMKLVGKVQADGYTLVPLSVYPKNGRIKIGVGLAKGKKMHDKRDVLKKKDQRRDIERAIKDSR